jgi:hypothetical protein
VFQQLFETKYLLNDSKNAASIAFILINCLLTIIIIWLVYRSERKVKVSFFITLIGVFLYLSTNILGKLLQVDAISASSMEIYILFTSPLITVFLLPAIKLL